MFDGLSDIPQFWQGVLASIFASMAVGITLRLWALISAQAREASKRRRQRFADVQKKLQSDNIARQLEGIFVTVFTVLKYFGVATGLWILAWTISFVESRISIALALAGVVFYYLGLRWLSPVRFPPSLLSREVPVIQSARYGAHESWVDVTEVVAKELTGDHLEVKAGNHLAGDPSPGALKTLVVQYTHQGKVLTKETREGETARIP